VFTNNKQLILSLIDEGWLKTPAIIDAFLHIKREDFVPPDEKDIAYLNTALPIGFGQTISQPLVVAFMLELLKPQKGDKVLDVGCGSGWTTALIAYLVQPQGKVIGIDIIKELVMFAQKNIEKYQLLNKGIVQLIHGDGKLGFKKEAPYDKILVSASSSQIPTELLNQLKTNGRLVIPIKDSIVLVEKMHDNNIKKTEFPGFAFVPLV
jgi:protein-L-isoaspartate(D-aspartate) O-methyltransferase